jgi:hypothetical protein
MEEEDTDGDSGDSDESDDSDEEENEVDAPVPDAWNQYFSSRMTVNDGHDSAWEYHQNNLAKGAIYPDKKHLQDAIIAWTMSTQRMFKTTVSSQKYLTMVCKVDGCPARVHGYCPQYETTWVLSDLVLHTCVLPHIPLDHENLSSTRIARLFYTLIVTSKAMEVSSLQELVFAKYNYLISYGKAWRAKQRALEIRFGTFVDSYNSVVRLLNTLQARNPGTYVNIQDFYMPEFPTVRVLNRVFFSFNICIEAFRHCRPVLCVDGISLASTRIRSWPPLAKTGTIGSSQLRLLSWRARTLKAGYGFLGS